MGEVKINIAVIGNSGVGKTSIINRYEVLITFINLFILQNYFIYINFFLIIK